MIRCGSLDSIAELVKEVVAALRSTSTVLVTTRCHCMKCARNGCLVKILGCTCQSLAKDTAIVVAATSRSSETNNCKEPRTLSF